MALVFNTGAPAARGQFAWLPALLLAAGLGLAGLAGHAAASAPWREVAAHIASRHWPAAAATIGGVGLAEIAAPGGGRRLALVVSYAYQVDGTTHQGSRASLFDQAGLDDRRLKALYARLNFARVTGAAVPVFHHPDEPGMALLDRGLPWRPAPWRAGLGLALLAAGLGCVAAAFRRLRRRQPSVEFARTRRTGPPKGAIPSS